MIRTSALLREAARYSQTLSLSVDILYGSELVLTDVPTLDTGVINADRGQKARLTASITVDLSEYPGFKLSQYVHRFRLSRGYQSLGVYERVTHGTFRIDEITYNDDGTVSLDGSGLESYIVDARFIRPRTPPYGGSTIGQIKYLIREVLPDQRISVETGKDRTIRAKAPWARERWDAIDALADSLGVEVFADYRGIFVIRDIPSVRKNKVVWRLNEGDDEVIISRSRAATRDRVYNAVSVSGQSSDPNKPPVWGWAYDSDPHSPTYYYGPFGQVPRFYSSQFFRTKDQCVATAKSMLKEALAKNESLTVDALPLTFLEVGDVIEIVLETGAVERRILQKTGFGLGTSSSVSLETLLPKDVSADGDI